MEDLENLKSIEQIYHKGAQLQPKEIISDSPEALAQMQLNAYNAHDLEAFLEPYSEDVEIYTFPNELSSKGKDAMREGYGQMFQNLPDLHCELVSRVVQGNTVIDQEKVIFAKDKPASDAIAIYKIIDGKIAKVYFIQ